MFSASVPTCLIVPSTVAPPLSSSGQVPKYDAMSGESPGSLTSWIG